MGKLFLHIFACLFYLTGETKSDKEIAIKREKKMKAKLFNTLTFIVGVGAMVAYSLEAGPAADFGTLCLMWFATTMTSFIGTTAIVVHNCKEQNRREAALVQSMIENASN